MNENAHATASHHIAVRLVRAILGGDYGPGERLSTEREMAEHYGVSRHVVREALKRLEALGLVRIVQGSGAYANDVLLHGGFELYEYLMTDASGHFDPAVVRDLFTFWEIFLPDLLRLAALHRDAQDVVDLRTTLRERGRSMDDLDAYVRANQRVARAVARATHNSVYQLIFNNVVRIFIRLRVYVPLEEFAPLLPQENLERIIEAIERQDPEMAELLGRRETARNQQGVEEFLRRVVDIRKR